MILIVSCSVEKNLVYLKVFWLVYDCDSFLGY